MAKLREHWSSRLSFILVAAGSAIGLGTMWMLPYTMGENGGGAFILVFLGFILIVGIPLFIAELIIGRETQKGLTNAFAQLSPSGSSWSPVGWLGIISSHLIAGWYAVVAGWGFNYVLMSLSDSFKNRSSTEVAHIFDVFRASGDLNVLWQFVFLFASAAILCGGVSKGIEYWSRILTSLLFLILTALAIYSATLSGFSQAVQYVLMPNFNALSAEGILNALALALFTLSLGQGVMVTYGSYLSDKDDVPQTSLIVGASIIFVSILVALMIFPMVFTFNFQPQEGEGLIFKTLPFVFERLPGGTLISVTFFILLIFAAITSSVSQLEVLVANYIDLYGWSRLKAVFVSASACFLIGLPTALSESSTPIFPQWPEIFQRSFLDTNYIIINWMLMIFAFCTAIFVGYKIPEKARYEGFSKGTRLQFLYQTWLFLIRFVVPTAIVLVMLNRARLLG